MTKEKVLATANAQREVINLPVLADLTKTTSLKEGMATPSPEQPQRIPKAQALADIRASREALAEIDGEITRMRIIEVTADLNTLAGDSAVATSVKRESFFTTGMELTESGVCPFCDTPWDLNRLKKHVQAKIDHLEDVSRMRQAAERKIVPLIVTLRKVQAAINTVVGYATLTKPLVAINAARDYSSHCRTAIEKLTAFLPLSETITVLTNMPTIPPAVLSTISKLEKAVVALPEPTKQDSTREWLTVAQERLEVWRDAMRKQKVAKDQVQKARQVSDIYNATSDILLSGIYATVEKDFSAIYQFINQDDEDEFKAKLIPSMGKLGFDVDFYGRGFFPPGAYHSEGHQDSMGLCLYLALMRYLQGSKFTFAVLDDVLMSVDIGHRRKV
ncbi:MAG: chromosome segregation protein SMC, partial [Thermodesulfobacteriota bacterium]|nr:chromosome segregation protein SMC [Thermodesulfobacteriota bacterium]